jgi:hypothetical protein
VQWSKLKTCRDFVSILRKTEINGKKYKISDLCFIFEDIDANKSKVLKRRVEKYDTATNIHAKLSNEDVKDAFMTQLIGHIKEEPDELSLDCILNVLDGVAELNGAMLFFTTNHIEELDPAFLRPGRMDYKIEFCKASFTIIREMLSHYYGIEKNQIPLNENIREYVLPICDVQNACFTSPTIEECLKILGNA